MQLTALIYNVTKDNYFSIILDGRKISFYMQKHIEKQFGRYLRKGTLVTFEFEDNLKKHRGIVSYKVLYFIEISSVSKRPMANRVSYYNIEYIRKGIRELIKDMSPIMIVDFEMNMQDYRSIENFQQEIIETGMVLCNKDGQVLDIKHWYIKPTLFPKLTSRTMHFLKYSKEEVKKAVSFKLFYEEFIQIVKKYNPYVIVWGKSDITQWKKTCEINGFNDPVRFVNLLQLHTNYFNLDNSPGLFSMWEEYNGSKLEEQTHNSLEDALVTKDVYFKFKEKILK